MSGGISVVSEIISAFCFTELLEKRSDALPRRFDGSFGCFAHQVFELGEHLLDGVEVWAVRRQEQQPCAAAANGGTDCIASVTSEIIHDDYVAGLESRNQELLDIELEGFAIDRPIEHTRRNDPVMAQGGKEGHRLPVAMRDAGGKPFAL